MTTAGEPARPSGGGKGGMNGSAGDAVERVPLLAADAEAGGAAVLPAGTGNGGGDAKAGAGAVGADGDAEPGAAAGGGAPSSVAAASAAAYRRSGWAGHLTYGWLSPLLSAGERRQLAPDDLFGLDAGDAAASCADAFHAAWAAERRARPRRPSLVRALLASMGRPFWAVAPLKAASDALHFVSPWAVSGILRSFDPAAGVSRATAAAYVVALFAKMLVQSVLLQRYFMATNRVGVRVRSALSSAVHRKALAVAGSARVAGAGETTNLLAVDADRLGPDLFSYAHMLWSGPAQVLVAVACLAATIGGPATAATVAVLLASIPVNAGLTSALRRATDAAMEAKDTRVRRLGEALSAMRSIKLHGWEGRVLNGPDGIADGRRRELTALWRVAVWDAAAWVAWQLIPVLVSAAAFATLAFTGGALTPRVAFTALTLFGILHFPLSVAPEVVSALTEARVAARRITAFLLAPEVAGRRTTPPPKPLGWTAATDPAPGRWTAPAALHGGVGRWPRVSGGDGNVAEEDDSPPPVVLRDVTLAFPAGTLTAIVGAVGVGKSSLLAALLGDLAFTPPEAAPHCTGRIGYAAQSPWVLNATIRANILFHAPYDAARYEAVLAACALRADLATFPAGDATEVGERGVTLSGGQAARLSLARAVYRRPDVLLLDDVFSALDATVGRHVFDATLDPTTGLCAGVTTVLVTHDLSLLPRVDRVVVLGTGGAVVDAGAYAEVAARGNALQDVRRYDGATDRGAGGNAEAAAPVAAPAPLRPSSPPAVDKQLPAVVVANGVAVAVDVDVADASDGRSGGADPLSGRLMTTEARVAGKVSGSVYGRYARSFGPALLAIAVATAAIAQALLLGTDGWLAKWSTAVVAAGGGVGGAATAAAPTAYYLAIYLGLSLAVAVGIVCHQAVMAWGTLRAGARLHDELLAAVFRAPMAWYDATPVGRTLNLLSADLGVVDSELSESADGALLCGLIVTAALLVCIGVMPPVLAAAAPLAALYFHHARRYLASARELRRLQSVSRAPLLAALTESVRGASTVRSAFPTPLPAAVADAPVVVDGAAVPTLLVVASNRWLCLRLDAAGGVLVAAVATAAVAARGQGLPAAAAGLAVTWALNMTGNLNWLTQSYTRLEAHMTSVERVVATAATLPAEAPAVVPDTDAAAAAAGWPAEGRVEFQNVTMAYRPGLPPALNDVSLVVPAGTKLGVVGRTGAGKTSLLAALFRLVELSSGRITIDGVDVAGLGLSYRSRLGVVSQEPALFTGSVRANVDPGGTLPDSALWDALSATGMADRVATAGGLGAPVGDGGAALSAGERQLLCLARLLASRPAVVVLDEASASVDWATDAAVQRVLRSTLAGATLITIAHRLGSVADADQVVVMGGGRVLEVGPPADLRDRPGGAYAALVAAASAAGA